MNKLLFAKVIVLVLAINVCWANDSAEKASSVDKILEKLNQSVAALKTYQCNIEYLFDQPLFDSKTLRSGKLYYKKHNDNSALRINFLTLKQDDEKEKPFRED